MSHTDLEYTVPAVPPLLYSLRSAPVTIQINENVNPR